MFFSLEDDHPHFKHRPFRSKPDMRRVNAWSCLVESLERPKELLVEGEIKQKPIISLKQTHYLGNLSERFCNNT